MVLYISYDPHLTIQTFIKELLHNLDIPHTTVGSFEIHLDKKATAYQRELLERILDSYRISIIKDPRETLVRKIKSAIIKLVRKNSGSNHVTTSSYLSEELNYSYAHLAKVFSEVTFTSIENYVIIQKIEYVKHLMLEENLTLTEISHRLNYCSVAHLSRQFKETTGLTFSAFQKIIKMRQNIKEAQPTYEIHSSEYSFNQSE
jgi:AraC-like DNA-binding protein